MRKEVVITKTDVYHIENMDDFHQEPHQATLENVIRGRMQITGVGYSTIAIPQDIRDQIIEDVLNQIGGRKRSQLLNALLWRGASHWALGRFIYTPKQKRFIYCAGQDQSWEMADLRKYLYKL